MATTIVLPQEAPKETLKSTIDKTIENMKWETNFVQSGDGSR